MKFLHIALLCFAFPLVSKADRLIYPEKPVKLNKSSPVVQQVSNQFGLGLLAQNFKLSETKQSLLGQHDYYQQYANGLEVEGSILVVSTNNRAEILKIYNSTTINSQKSLLTSVPLISESMAMDFAWRHLNVKGRLMDRPKVKLVYNENFTLVYKVVMSVSAPFGHHEVVVNALNGQVMTVSDAALPRMKRAQVAPTALKSAPMFSSYSAALSSFEQNNQKNFFNANMITVNGTAQVFDPNPVVTLGRTDLEDESAAGEFTQAYKTEDLKDITFADGVYSLKGPKVTLIDFEGPDGAPSTSADGSWVFERGHNGFNEAMTYSHIDRSVRYIESMGFVNNRAVFNHSIEVDADGVDGADNSHYIPSSRRLAFGHGCVDDNEDSDVILHELGHAIQHHINSSWNGGDTGAMGEGFGDYWAASYSVTTDHGNTGNINWVFKWDGHNSCWPGRKLDSFSPAYNSYSRYGAHSQVNGGVSDELWSTPIFQAFLELYNRGVARADIDKIILEAHFGLGYGVKMPEMAKAIVKAAKSLFPDKDYDQVYTKHFKKMKMI